MGLKEKLKDIIFTPEDPKDLEDSYDVPNDEVLPDTGEPTEQE